MRAVLDEGVPRSPAKALRDRGIEADPFHNPWMGLRNGELLRRVEAAGYAVLVTNDRNMAYRQSLVGRTLAVVALPLNRQASIMERVADIADTIPVWPSPVGTS